MSEFQSVAAQLIDAIERDDDQAARGALTAIVVALGSAFERTAVAAERTAAALETLVARTREG